MMGEKTKYRRIKMGSRVEREGWKKKFNEAREKFLALTDDIRVEVSNEKGGELYAKFAKIYEKIRDVFEHMETRTLNLDNLKMATSTLNTSIDLISSIKGKSEWSKHDEKMLETLSENCGNMLKGKDKALGVCASAAWSGTCAVASVPVLAVGLTSIATLGIPTAAYDLIAGNKPSSPTNMGMKLVEMGLNPAFVLRGEAQKVAPQANMKTKFREIKSDIEGLKAKLEDSDAVTHERNPMRK